MRIAKRLVAPMLALAAALPSSARALEMPSQIDALARGLIEERFAKGSGIAPTGVGCAEPLPGAAQLD